MLRHKQHQTEIIHNRDVNEEISRSRTEWLNDIMWSICDNLIHRKLCLMYNNANKHHRYICLEIRELE